MSMKARSRPVPELVSTVAQPPAPEELKMAAEGRQHPPGRGTNTRV